MERGKFIVLGVIFAVTSGMALARLRATEKARSPLTVTVATQPSSQIKKDTHQVLGTPSPSPLPKPEPKPALPKWTLVWQQDFTKLYTGKLDPRYWNVATAKQPIYNDEAQKYSTSGSNVRISAGRLILEAHKTAAGYTSGRVDTKGKVKVTSGSRLEARIKLPKGRGTWPAFWLLSDNQPHTAKLHPTEAMWQQERFYMRDGEIDIMEAYGLYPGIVESTVYSFATIQERQHRVALDPEGFHTYWLEWRADRLVIGVDNITYHTYTKTNTAQAWPFTADNKFYIILNLALGGTGGGQIIQHAGDNWRMEVALLKYYKLR